MSFKFIGSEVVFPTVDCTIVYERGKKSAVLTYTGRYDKCEVIAAKMAPNGIIKFPKHDITLGRVELRRAEGNTGVLILTGAGENGAGGGDDDDDDDAQLIESRLRVSFMPRNVPLIKGISQDDFDPSLLEYWKRTEDYELKRNYVALVPVIDGVKAGEAVDVYQLTAKMEQKELIGTTRAIAQRIAIGMETYETYYPVVSNIEEWKGSKLAFHMPGSITGLPRLPPGNIWGAYSWICSGLTIDERPGNIWRTSADYTGILTTSTPKPTPDGWGGTPFDLMFYNS